MFDEVEGLHPMRSASFFLMVVLGMVQGYSQTDSPWKASQTAVERSSRRQDFNFEESQVPSYTLPDPLVFDDGSIVATPTQWAGVRREEILNLFRDRVYGRRPETPYVMEFKQINAVDNAIPDNPIYFIST